MIFRDSGALATRSGGTGLTAYNQGDLLYGSGDVGPNGLIALPIGAAGGILESDGSLPGWSALSWTAVAHDAANFFTSTSSTGWGVDAADMALNRYRRIGLRTLLWELLIVNSDVSSAGSLRATIPAGLVAAVQNIGLCRVVNAGAAPAIGVYQHYAGVTYIDIYSDAPGSGFSVTAGDNTHVWLKALLEVQ